MHMVGVIGVFRIFGVECLQSARRKTVRRFMHALTSAEHVTCFPAQSVSQSQDNTVPPTTPESCCECVGGTVVTQPYSLL